MVGMYLLPSPAEWVVDRFYEKYGGEFIPYCLNLIITINRANHRVLDFLLPGGFQSQTCSRFSELLEKGYYAFASCIIFVMVSSGLFENNIR